MSATNFKKKKKTIWTPLRIKEISREFDTEVIFRLDLSSQNITDDDTEYLGVCINIEWLNLSDNKIFQLCDLASLSKLRHLDLSINFIRTLEGLHALSELEFLDIAGNKIADFVELSWLAGLPNFATLHLRDRTRRLSNPICDKNPQYEAQIVDALPRLQNLDGWRRMGSGSELVKYFSEMDNRIKALALNVSETPVQVSEVPQSRRNSTATDMNLLTFHEAETELKMLLDECKLICNTSMDNSAE